ncbi:brix domain-containing protein, variant [Loa loa]|nr:brix domain-containing protein [Loa loa]XP_020307081.1 brix domain-containing protein, variant [Loa loa]EFO21564.1 brix domain-containing protein [Loa loa]EJD76271.1 brix domain-containing protein, variant [Loa loa]
MRRPCKETLTEEDSQEIGEASTASITSSVKSVGQNLNRLYKTIPNSARNERGKKLRLEKASAKRERQKMRLKLREKLGEKALPKEQPRTIESTREHDVTMIEDDDQEVQHDEANDEMNAYFSNGILPKILITTSPYAKVNTFKFCYELQKCIPNSDIFTRKGIPLKRVVKQAKSKEYTDLIVVHEDRKIPNGIVLCHLPDGPTAFFKINSLTFTKNLKKKGESTIHYPELVLNNFNTRLGHTIARMFACLFPQKAMYTGRRVVTFHNQRDYIFFRHHRYEFKKEGEKAALLELGPRFTLRLKWLQKGTFDTRYGEYEWVLKRHEMESSRRRFFL